MLGIVQCRNVVNDAHQGSLFIVLSVEKTVDLATPVKTSVEVYTK